jgi:uncharacterized RDD family membrane protein YckC
MLYEAIVLAALLLLASLPFAILVPDTVSGWTRRLLQLYFVVVLGLYFCHFWLKGGQTLAMQTWHIRLTGGADGLTRRQAVLRFLLVCLLFIPVAMLMVLFTKYRGQFIWLPWLALPAIASILWARFDPDRQFLHDRVLGTRLVQLPKGSSSDPR